MYNSTMARNSMWGSVVDYFICSIFSGAVDDMQELRQWRWVF